MDSSMMTSFGVSQTQFPVMKFAFAVDVNLVAMTTVKNQYYHTEIILFVD